MLYTLRPSIPWKCVLKHCVGETTENYIKKLLLLPFQQEMPSLLERIGNTLIKNRNDHDTPQFLQVKLDLL